MGAHDKLDSIQALRAIAAVSIVTLHAIGTGSRYTSSPSHLLDSARYLAFGVDLFFVISGFVIFGTVMRGRDSAAEFLGRRVRRIAPPYWVLTAVFFTCLLLVPGLNAAADASWQKFVASLAFVSFALGTTPVIYPGWTLEYEMAFYLLTAAAMLVSRRRAWAVVATVLSAASIVGVWLGAHPGPVLEFLTNSITLSFLAGILVAQLTIVGRVGRIEGLAFLVGVTFAAIHNPDQRVLYAGLPSAIAVWWAVRWKGVRVKAWLVELGNASYAIYLLHVFVIAVVGKLIQSRVPSLNAEVLAATMVVSAILGGCVFHRWIELPLMRLRFGSPLVRKPVAET